MMWGLKREDEKNERERKGDDDVDENDKRETGMEVVERCFPLNLLWSFWSLCPKIGQFIFGIVKIFVYSSVHTPCVVTRPRPHIGVLESKDVFLSSLVIISLNRRVNFTPFTPVCRAHSLDIHWTHKSVCVLCVFVLSCPLKRKTVHSWTHFSLNEYHSSLMNS